MDEDKDRRQIDVATRWRPRPMAARALAVSIVTVPMAVSLGFALVVGVFVPEPSSAIGEASWWIGLLLLSAIVYLMSERTARRALPLASLLKLGLVFPGDAPGRLAVAKRASQARDLGRWLDEARSTKADCDPVIAADTVVKLVAALSARDRAKRGDPGRVSAFTDLIGNELGLAKSEQDRLHWAALLHDVGSRHPLEGTRLAAPLRDWLGDWGSTIAEKDEHYDGSGRPLGLAGEGISLGGRIIAVAAAYDLMTSVGSYRGPVSQDAARAEIARRGGSQFDPVVVRAFLALPARKRPAISPATWFGILPVNVDGFEVTAFFRATAAILVLGSVLALAAWGQSPAHAAGKARSGSAHGVDQTGPSADGSDDGLAASGFKQSQMVVTRALKGKSPSARADKNSGSRSPKSAPRRTGTSRPDPGTTKTTSGSPPGSGDPKSPSTTSPGSTSTTGSPPGTTPPTTGSPPTTSPPRPPPPTTTTTIPAPSPAKGLAATSSCKDVLLGPEISLRWTDSSSWWVTSYEILRSSDGSVYGPIAEVASGATSFTDFRVQGLGTTYWYKVTARSPEGSTTSEAVSATTPPACV